MAQHEPNDPEASRAPSFVDRVLSLATEVRPGEGATALLLALDVFLLLSAYYVVKPVREGLILSQSTAEIKSYASVGQALILLAVVPLYGSLVNRVRREVLIPLVTLFFVCCFVLFYLLAQSDYAFVGVSFYLFVGVFNLMVIAQFWSFANDLYTKEEGERLFPVVAFGASIGAIGGSALTSLMVDRLGLEEMLLVGAGILGSTIAITRIIESRSGRHTEEAERKEDEEEDKPEDHEVSAFMLVLRSRYLLLIAGLMFLTNLVNTTGEFLLGRVVKEWAEQKVAEGATGLSVGDTIGKFYGEFYFWVNTAGATMQFFLVSRIIRWIGVGGGLIVLPVIALGSYVGFALFPVLLILKIAKTAENATDYSLNNTVRNALFLPLTRAEKYKAKQAVDTFFVRGGDVASAGVVALGLRVLTWENEHFAWFNVVTVGVWLLVAVAIARLYRRYDDDANRES